METKFLERLTELLERESPVNLEDMFRDYGNWDSLAHLIVISFVDEDYGIVIPRDDFNKMKTVQEIYDYIVSHSK